MANRYLGEVFQIPKAQRVVAVIDCKGAVEGAKWARVADAVAGTIEEADIIFSNIDEEMKRREALVKSDIESYWDSRIKPNDRIPLILIYIDELAVLGNPVKEDKDLESIRKHAMFVLNQLLFRARSSAISVIAAVQRPDSALFGSSGGSGGGTRNNFQNRLCGRVDSPISSDVAMGQGMAQAGVDASKLTDHWFIAQIEGKGIFRFKTPGAMDDSDLKAVALNPRFYAPEGRGDWLTAEPGTPESIAPWWNGDGSLKDNYMFDLESGHEPEPSPVPDPEFFGSSSQPSSDFYDEDDDCDSEPEVEMSIDDLADAVSNPDAVYQQFGRMPRQSRRQGERKARRSVPRSEHPASQPARRPVRQSVPQYDPVFGDGFLPARNLQNGQRAKSNGPSPIKDGVDYLESLGLEFEEFTEEELARPQRKGHPAQSNRNRSRARRESASPSPIAVDLQVEYRQARRRDPEDATIKNAAPLFESDENDLEDDVAVGFEEIAEKVESIPLDEAEEVGGVDAERRRRRSRNKKGEEAKRQTNTEADDDDWFSRI